MHITPAHFQFRLRILRLCLAVVAGILPLLLVIWHTFPAPAALSSPQLTDLQIEKIGPDKSLAGQQITYTLQITNNTGTVLDGVSITDTWTLQDYAGSYQAAGSITVLTATFVATPPRYVRFDLAPLAPGAIGQIQVGMAISSALQPDLRLDPTVLGNSAYITTSTSAKTANSDNVNTIVAGPVLQLIPTLSPLPPTEGTRPGRLITLALSLENKYRSDSVDATNVVVTQVLPAFTDFFTSSATSGLSVYSPSVRSVFWYMPQLLVGGRTTTTITMRISPTATYGTIVNPSYNCGAIADELPKVVACWQGANFLVNDVFEKQSVAVSPPAQSYPISSTFNSRVLTYTVFVYNPFTQTVPSIRVTDTLPNVSNNPAVSFQYLDIVTGTNPPAFVSYSGTQVVWDTPPIAGWDVYSFTFRVWVPPAMPIDPNQDRREYANTLDGAAGSIVLPRNIGYHDYGMRVFLFAQVLIDKVVTPTSQITGAPVTYTLKLSNTGPTTITGIRVTETLPSNLPSCNFQWGGMVAGQAPATTTVNSAVWTGITLTAYSSWSATFTATVLGALYSRCTNMASADSPDTFIPTRVGFFFSPVNIDSPFRYSKSVNPTSIVLGGGTTYSVTEYNIGAVDAVMNGFTDTLPAGFYFGASAVFTDMVGVPFTLTAKQQNAYNVSFPVNVVSTSVSCDALPANVYQDSGKFGIRIISPLDLAGFWSNASGAAPVLLRPQVTLVKTSNRPEFIPGDSVTFTLVLSNNTQSPIAGTRITDTLPPNWTYIGVLAGTPQPISTSNGLVVWDSQTVPGGGILTLQFMAALPATPINAAIGATNYLKASVPANPLICMPRAQLNMIIREPVVLVNKTAVPVSVTPLGKFQYDISFQNRAPYTVTIQRFTETLPGLTSRWRFDSMASAAYPQPLSTSPIVWQNLSIAPYPQTTHLAFYVRAGTDFGQFVNLWAPAVPPAGAGVMTGTAPQGYTLTTVANYLGAPVSVIPGVGLDKIVSPESLISGEQALYTITLVNLSGNTITNVRMTDTLPAGFIYNAMVSGPAPVITSPVTWAIGDVLNGDANRITLSFRATVGISTPTGTYFNRLYATSSSVLIPPTDDTAPVYVISAFGPQPDLAISKDDGQATATVGDVVSYTIVYTNGGDAAATGIVLTETLPSNTTLLGPPEWQLAAPSVYTRSVPDASPSQSGFVTVALLISGPSPTGLYTNSASIRATDERITGNNIALDVDMMRVLDLQVSKSDGLSEVSGGQFITYVINYTNAGNDAVQNVILTDTLGADLIRVGRTWYSAGGGVFTYSVGTLAAGASGAVPFAAQVSPSALGGIALTNSVTIGFAGLDSNPVDNAASDVDVVSFANLRLALEDGVAIVRPNQIVTYTYTFQNIGGATAGSAVLRATLPVSLAVLAAPGWSTDPSGYVLSIGDLTPGTTGVATIVAQAPANLAAGMRLTTTGIITGVSDVTLADNQVIDIDFAQSIGPDLQIVAASAGTPYAGLPVTLIVTVTNAGSAATADYFFVDLYVNRVPSGRTDLGDAWSTTSAPTWPRRVQVPTAILPGDVRQLTYHFTPPAEGAYSFYAQADTCDLSSVGPGLNCIDPSYGRIAELDEVNNVYGPLVVNVQAPLHLYLPLIRR